LKFDLTKVLMYTKLAISLVGVIALAGYVGHSAHVARPGFVQLSSQKATASVPASSAAKSGSAKARNTDSLDACALIEKSEITSLQGLEVQQAQPGSLKYGELDVSQCYYAAVSPDGLRNLSVHLQVIMRNPQSNTRGALNEFWKARFDDERKVERREESEESEEDGPKAPVRVPGIGDKAFWLASDRGGALFVLKKDKIVRVTVGGTGDPEASLEKSLEKSKTLARLALARLK